MKMSIIAFILSASSLAGMQAISHDASDVGSTHQEMVEGCARTAITRRGPVASANTLSRTLRCLHPLAASKSMAGGARAERPAKRSSSIRVAQAQTVREASTGGAGGAESSDSQSTLGEVIVTAQKRAQRAFDVPISLVVLNSEGLLRREITNMQDLQSAVPGLTVQAGGAQQRINIRGVSNSFGNGAVVGEYVDEADATPAADAAAFGFGQFDMRMYDLERVEVLRGPQGTLFGVGAMGGVIRFITNKPALGRFEMTSDVATLFTQSGAPSQRVDAMVNAPVLSNTVAIRVAGEFEHDGGWIDEPAANLKNINGQNLVDVRIEGLWQPSPAFKAYATQIIHRNQYGLGTGEDANGNYNQSFGLTLAPTGQDSLNLSNLTLTYTLDTVQLLSSTTYFSHSLTLRNWGATFYDLGGLQDLYPTDAYPKTNDLSEEFRVSRIGGRRWQWTVGGFYKRYSDTNVVPAEYFAAPGPLPSPAFTDYFQLSQSKSWSAFVDSSYRLFDRLTIGGGVRYFKDEESEFDTFDPLERATFTSTDPRGYVRYQLTRNINVYTSAAKGFRSGGFNGFGLPIYSPESLWSYELGTKMRLLDRRLTFDTDVFYSNYSKYLVYGIVPGPGGALFNTYSNAGVVRIKGIDSEVVWRPTDEWEFSVNGEILSAKFVEITAPGSVYYVGERVDLVPRYSFATAIERDFELAGRAGFARLDYSEVGRERFAGSVDYLGLSDVIRMLNMKVSVELNQNLRVGVFAENLLNNRGYMNPYNLETLSTRPRPRTIGLEFGMTFQ